jgi:hypothetical protein
MSQTDTTKQNNSTQSASSEKKPFVAPRLEKMDTALTANSFTGFGADFGMYSS